MELRNCHYIIQYSIGINQFGYELWSYDFSFAGVSVPSGTNYITLSNANIPNGDPIYWDENSGPSTAYENNLGSIPSETFSLGGSTPPPPPPPPRCFNAYQTLSIIHDFTGMDGTSPSGVAIDKAGNLYGTTPGGGDNSLGLVYKLALKDQEWAFTPLYSFTGGYNGGYPSTPIVGPNGGLYGSAAGGIQNCGYNGYCGLIYRMRPAPNACRATLCSWTEDVLYRKTGDNDPMPGRSLVFDQAGNLYGLCDVTQGYGGVCELTPSHGGWTATLLYSFTGGSDGRYPSSLVVGNDGNLYGTARAGGAYGGGVIFQLSPSGSGWTEAVLYDFQGPEGDGSDPGWLGQDSSGNLYGLSKTGKSQGFESEREAVIFMLSPSDGKWVFSELLLLGFGWGYAANVNNLAVDAGGAIYATEMTTETGCGGKRCQEGMSPSDWQYLGGLILGKDVFWYWPVDFSTSGALAVDAQGNLYGTTSDCGKYGGGTVWVAH